MCPLFVQMVLLCSTFCLSLLVVFNDVSSPNITYLTFVNAVTKLPGSLKKTECVLPCRFISVCLRELRSMWIVPITVIFLSRHLPVNRNFTVVSRYTLDFMFPPRTRWDLRPSGILQSVRAQKIEDLTKIYFRIAGFGSFDWRSVFSTRVLKVYLGC